MGSIRTKRSPRGKKRKGHIRSIRTPYANIAAGEYEVEKRRLQYELLKIQQTVVRDKRRLAIVFEGRDAAGKGATIKRLVEHMMPKYYRIVELGVPTPKESKNWFNRYKKHMPQAGEVVFFDRSWYTRALIEPTMGYCSESQYRYFMRNVLKWEARLMSQKIELVKFYLSVNMHTQLIRFNKRMNDPLKFWKLSPNDLKARKNWKRFSAYKEQMFARTSSDESPWVLVNSNSKREGMLTCMLYLTNFFQHSFKPLTGKPVNTDHNIEIAGVQFRGLSAKQYAIMVNLLEQVQWKDGHVQ